MGNTTLEARLSAALLAGGARLMQAVQAALAARGLPAELEMSVQGNRLRLASRSRAVIDAETGRVGVPPLAPLEDAARAVAPEVARAVAATMRGEAG